MPPADPKPPSGALKDMFSPTRYRAIADDLGAAEPRFDRRRFLRLVLDGLEERELMDRLSQTANAAHAALPGPYRHNLEVLTRVAESGGGSSSGFAGIWFSDYAGRHGLDDVAAALPALRCFTRYGSAEFAIRAFLARDLTGTLAVMRTWADDPNEHVRRLASEGCRPRLPWGRKLVELIKDPSPTGPILEALKADPSLYVRKSVANHLNDIAKDHPGAVLERVRGWDRTHTGTAWIVRHALRTLIKQGHPDALALIGAAAAPELHLQRFTVSPRRLQLGESLRLYASLVSTCSSSQRLVVDYVVHYVKADGSARPKVFKWRTVDLAPGETLVLEKTQRIQDFSTRRHYPGQHRVQLQINGRCLGESDFKLRLS